MVLLGHEDAVNVLAWSPDSTMWAIGDESGYVWVYNVDGTLVDELRSNYGNVDTLAWSPDGTMLAGGNMLWELRDGHFKIRNIAGRGRVWSLAWSPDSQIIASEDTTYSDVRLYDTNGHQLLILMGHSGSVERVTFSPVGRLLASASQDHTIRLWDVSDIQPEDEGS
jgi:WD40 repeat protein